MQICLPANDLSTRRLSTYAALGVEAVSVPHRVRVDYVASSPKPLVPPAGRGAHGPQPAPPEPAELRRVVERVRGFGLVPCATGLGLSRDLLTGGPGRDIDVARFQESLRVVGDAGIGVVALNFTPLRASEGYGSRHGGRGEAHVRDFDAARIDGLPPLPDVGEHRAEALWDSLTWFLEATVPVAAAAGVRFGMHPNDPPVPVFRGVAQPLCNMAAMRRLVGLVDAPANAIYYDCGVAAEWGEDPVEVARWFARRDRIAIAHIRNVRVAEPGRRYTETLLDDGDVDIGAVLRGLREEGYRGTIDPDHTPGLAGDMPEMWMGWAWAVGMLRGLRSATPML